MKTARNIAAALLFGALGLMHPASNAEEARLGGVKRINLLQNDLSVSGRQVIQVLVSFAPGLTAQAHSHHGEEIVYVVEGVLEYQLEGKPPVTLKAGDALFIPNGTIHSVKNVGNGNASELATYIVEKGMPLVTLAE
jgi:quercetin dioxygenase-like cupin family protein